MAEGVGFEPTEEYTPLNGFRGRRLQPLSHPSARRFIRIAMERYARNIVIQIR